MFSFSKLNIYIFILWSYGSYRQQSAGKGNVPTASELGGAVRMDLSLLEVLEDIHGTIDGHAEGGHEGALRSRRHDFLLGRGEGKQRPPNKREIIPSTFITSKLRDTCVSWNIIFIFILLYPSHSFFFLDKIQGKQYLMHALFKSTNTCI